MTRYIMVVDDDLDDIQLFQEALTEIEPALECKIAGNGMEALALLESAIVKPDLIFVDMNMPLLNGKDFIKMIRQNKIYNSIRLFLYSTADMSSQQPELVSIGASGFLRKPTSYIALRDGLSEVIHGFYNNQPSGSL